MNIKELKRIIKDIPEDTPILFCTYSMFMTDDISIEFHKKDGMYYDKDCLVACADNN